MMTRARQIEASSAIMDMLSTIIFYKFKTLSRDEVNTMLGYTIDELKESRAYQEIYAEGQEKGLEKGLEKGQRDFTLMQLNRKLGQLSPQQQTRIQSLSVDRLQDLGLALLEFTRPADLEVWLDRFGYTKSQN
jgi:predicted transposase YdaD